MPFSKVTRDIHMTIPALQQHTDIADWAYAPSNRANTILAMKTMEFGLELRRTSGLVVWYVRQGLGAFSGANTVDGLSV